MHRSPRSRSFRIAPPAALVLAAGLAAPASGVDKSWMCAGGDWSNIGCWSSPLGTPGQSDVARIGNSANAENSIVHLDVNNEIIAGLHITDGMTLDTYNFTMEVTGNTTISGRNTVNAIEYPSRLRVDPAVDGPDFETANLTVSNEAVVQLNGGGVLVSDLFTLGAGSAVEGFGSLYFSGGGTTFVNNGTIHPASINISLWQEGPGLYDLDGTSEDGSISLDSPSSTRLNIEGTGLADPFSGSATMLAGTVLDVDLSEGWTADAPSQFNIYGALGGNASVITGSAWDFAGTFNLYGSSHLRMPAAIEFQDVSEMVLGEQAFAEFQGSTVIHGGLFTLFNQADIDFDGPTEIRGGMFITQSDSASQGSVDFSGATEWDGTVTVDGIARQFGPATVSGATIININTFDMDGNGSTTWTINESLVLNADRIDTGTSDFSGTLNVGGGLFGRITVNLTDPTESWIVSGAMNLSGNSLLFNTRVGNGSPLIVTGDIGVVGKVDIATPTTLEASATISVPAANAALRFMSSSFIPVGVGFSGDGAIQNGGLGVMTLEDGLVTGSVGLINGGGELHIGAGPGIVSVDRFQQSSSGEWVVQIGGYAAGDEFDRLIVSSDGAALGGSIVIEHIDANGAGDAFRPLVGDTFIVLTAIGGVSGAFAPSVTSMVDGYTYHWSVVTGPNDVTLRVDAIDRPCIADFNADGVVNSQDFFDFLTMFFVQDASADVNADAVVNSQDFFDFLTAFFSGC